MPRVSCFRYISALLSMERTMPLLFKDRKMASIFWPFPWGFKCDFSVKEMISR